MARAAALAFVLLFGFTMLGCRAETRSNVIVVSIDTLRADHLGVYAYPRSTSPTIDRLSAEGVVFRQVVSAASSTLLSHASIFTSLIPQHHGASYFRGRALSASALTLAEVLRRSGYATLGITGGGQFAAVYGIAAGFETFDDTLSTDPYKPGEFDRVVQRGFEMIDDRPRSPFFLFLHTYETHHPYTPTPESLALFESGYQGSLPREISPELLKDINEGRRSIAPRDRAHIVAAYDAEIRSVDDAFGRLVDGLASRGLLENSIIVFTSDHGEEFGERGYMGWHSHTVFDELIRVPLLVWLPNHRFAGRKVDDLVRSIDLAPTILELVDLRVPSEFEGRSIVPILEGERLEPVESIFLLEAAPADLRLSSGIRLGKWKLQPGGLFDLKEDPGEIRNLSTRFPDIAASLFERLRRAIEARAPFRGRRVAPTPLDELRLRSLGYLS